MEGDEDDVETDTGEMVDSVVEEELVVVGSVMVSPSLVSLVLSLVLSLVSDGFSFSSEKVGWISVEMVSAVEGAVGDSTGGKVYGGILASGGGISGKSWSHSIKVQSG